MQEDGIVDIRPLKKLSSDLLSKDSMLRRVLNSENDTIAAAEFIAKLGTWLTILREEFASS